MTTAPAVVVAATFTWLGMVLAISFLEAPLKFRAAGVTVRTGLAIGRLVFRALNVVEAVLAAAILVTLVANSFPGATVVALACAIVALLFQLGIVRPQLNRRTRAVLAGQDAPRSRAHHAYIGLELGKVAALIVGGVLLFSS